MAYAACTTTILAVFYSPAQPRWLWHTKVPDPPPLCGGGAERQRGGGGANRTHSRMIRFHLYPACCTCRRFPVFVRPRTSPGRWRGHPLLKEEGDQASETPPHFRERSTMPTVPPNSPNPPNTPPWRASTHPAGLDDTELLAQCSLGRGRTSGPGGQHRNRVATQVILTHTPTGLVAQAGERRSPETNKAVALHRLRYLLALHHRSPVAAGEARTELWARRCTKAGRIVCATKHHDHATLIAEALDVIAAGGWDVRKAATRLCCTQTQLVRLLAEHPPALELLNRERETRGLRRLHSR